MLRLVTLLCLTGLGTGLCADALLYTLDGSKSGPLPALTPGLHSDYAEGTWSRLPRFHTLDGMSHGVVSSPDLSIRKRDDHFACRFHGVLHVTDAGTHQFTLNSDDGSRLRIAGETIIDLDGLHSATAKSATVDLKQGFYPFELSYFEATVSEKLELNVTFPDGRRGPIPPQLLLHPADRAFSAGEKTLQSEVVHHKEPYLLRLKVDFSAARDLEPLIGRIHEAFTSSWAPTLDLLGQHSDAASKVVHVTFKPGIKAPAYAEGRNITISTAHLRRNPEDTIGVFIHELSHVLQDYRGRGPGWFTEGSADYVRFKLNPDDAWARHCRRNIQRDNPFGSYWPSTAFLLYLEATYQKPIVKAVSQSIIAENYQPGIWQDITGKSLEALAAEYAKSTWTPE